MATLTYYCEDESLAATLEQCIAKAEAEAQRTGHHSEAAVVLSFDEITARATLAEQRKGRILLTSGAIANTLNSVEGHSILALPKHCSQIIRRIQSCLSDAPSKVSTAITLHGSWQLNQADTLCCSQTEETIALTEKESQLLRHLLQNTGEVIERDMLLKQVWGYEGDTQTNTLETHMYRLRGKLAALNLPKECGILTKEEGYVWIQPESA